MNLAKTDRRRAAIARKAAWIGPDSRVLDAGCGKPSFLKLFNKKTGCRAKGIDWSRSMEDKFIGFMAGMLLTAP